MKQFQLLVRSFRDNAIREPGYVFSQADDAPEPEKAYAVPYVAPAPAEKPAEVKRDEHGAVIPEPQPANPDAFASFSGPAPEPFPAPEPAPPSNVPEPTSMAETKPGAFKTSE